MFRKESTVDASELVSIYQSSNPGEAEIIKSALLEEGIPCELGGESQAGFTGMFAIDVLVRAVDAERAREFIESHSGQADDAS